MSVPEIQAEELKQRLDQGDNLFLLDVRDEYEYEISNIGGPPDSFGSTLKAFERVECARGDRCCLQDGTHAV